MKKFFFKRHFLFFVTLAILLLCLLLIAKHYFLAYNNKITQRENIAALVDTLSHKRRQLPDDYLSSERRMQTNLQEYKKFIGETWQKMMHLPFVDDFHSVPSNHVAVFFEISNYLLWAKESCDAMGLEFENTCSFGFMNTFEKNERPLFSETVDIHQQKEQLKLLLSYLLKSKSSYLKIISMERGDDSQSTYFDSSDVFIPNVRQVASNNSHIYRIKFTTFTNSFRNFLGSLYDNEIPIIIRQITIQPNYTFKLVKNNPDQVSECLASTYTLTVEFLDIPASLSKYSIKNAALLRRILYETAP
ncbi:MAG: hypothetical protein LBI56_00145 [Puniceicoccales bacterium]|jgi:hypothetical protein|nr:hypothetical protein [Puniceicoccales bacterium]